MNAKIYWNNVEKVRKNIYDRMISMGAETLQGVSPVNPNRQIKANGAIGLEFYYGFPSELYTPLGKLPIFESFISDVDETALLNNLTEAYGLVKVIEGKQCTDKYVGPIYSITKLPWSSEELPMYEPRNYKDYLSCNQAMRIYNALHNSESEQSSSSKGRK